MPVLKDRHFLLRDRYFEKKDCKVKVVKTQVSPSGGQGELVKLMPQLITLGLQITFVVRVGINLDGNVFNYFQSVAN